MIRGLSNILFRQKPAVPVPSAEAVRRARAIADFVTFVKTHRPEDDEAELTRRFSNPATSYMHMSIVAGKLYKRFHLVTKCCVKGNERNRRMARVNMARLEELTGALQVDFDRPDPNRGCTDKIKSAPR